MPDNSEERVIYLHGFERDDLFKIIKAIKASIDYPGEIAFSTSTPTNLEWKIKDMIAEVREDHAFFKEQEKKKKQAK
jgi:tRNA U34 5-carboxymethylaminomethyl modifying GTPase MnmE/TrmE